MRQIGQFSPEARRQLRIDLNADQDIDTPGKHVRQRAPAGTYLENEITRTHT
jgi:hypothetical protein